MRASRRIADRMALLDASGIRKVFDLAARLKDPINLSIGQPDFDVSPVAKAAAIAAIEHGHNKYTQTQGDAPLRRAVSEACRREFGWEGDHPLLITCGVSGALTLAFLTLVNPGDEVVMVDPSFVIYQHMTNICGGKPVFVDTYPDFLPDPDRIAAAVTDRTRMLIVNSPSNPTGRVYPTELLEAIAAIATSRDLLVLSDEIYNHFCYDQPFVSIASFHENTLVMRGFSKSYGMPGWRLGWCAGPGPIIEKMTMLQQYTFVCAPSMAQAGATAALDVDVSAHIDAYRHKRDIVQAALDPAFGMGPLDGAFYAFVPAPKGLTGTQFVEKAIARNVLMIPGGVFSQRDSHFRISYAVSDEKLREGMKVLVALA